MMDLQQVEARLANLTAEHRSVAATVDELSRRRADAARQAEEQREKLLRAQRQVAKMQARVGGEDAPLSKEADLAEVGVGELGRVGVLHEREGTETGFRNMHEGLLARERGRKGSVMCN